MLNDIKFTALLDELINLNIEEKRLLAEFQRTDVHSDYKDACWKAAGECRQEIIKVKAQMDKLNEEKYGNEVEGGIS